MLRSVIFVCCENASLPSAEPMYVLAVNAVKLADTNYARILFPRWLFM